MLDVSALLDHRGYAVARPSSDLRAPVLEQGRAT